MSDRDLTHLHPDLQPLCQKFLDQCRAERIDAFITQTYRSPAEQDADYAQGRTTPGHIVTNARAGQSKHNFTLDDGTPASKAFDFGIKDDETGELDWDASDARWQRAIAIGEALGMVSGSRWHSIVDTPHFEIAEAVAPTA
jgi:peptidoglycan LD-endopeptidase CwlK